MAKVYVSSTFNDLKDHRAAVREILRQLDHTDMSMEYNLVTEDWRPVEKCLDDVAASDVYVGVFAWRYGWKPELNNPAGRSITHLEYLRARESGKPCLIFALDQLEPWTAAMDADLVPITRLLNELSERHGVKAFTTPDNLAAQLAVSLMQLR